MIVRLSVNHRRSWLNVFSVSLSFSLVRFSLYGDITPHSLYGCQLVRFWRQNLPNGRLFNFNRIRDIGLAIQLKTCCLLRNKSQVRPALMLKRRKEKKTWTLENWAPVSRYGSQARDQVWFQLIVLLKPFKHLIVLLHYKIYLLKVSLC